MKNLMIIAALLIGSISMAQEVKPKLEKTGENTIQATYYYSTGQVNQVGVFKNNKRHGEWISYNLQGEKIAQAQYDNGEKTGKWFFWNGGQLSEVDYNNNTVVSVNTWVNKNPVATNQP